VHAVPTDRPRRAELDHAGGEVRFALPTGLPDAVDRPASRLSATPFAETERGPDGALAGTVGQVIGTGEGRGIGLAYVVFALVMGSINLGALGLRTLRRFDTEVPDSLPDDVVGVQERERAAPTG
jgi:hypothetical protein